MFGDKDKEKHIKVVTEKSVIGSDFTIEGLVNSAGEVELSGSIKGPVNVRTLRVREKGSLIGEISVENIEVDGFVDGKISAQNVTIGSTGEVVGDIEFSETFKVDEGAALNGHVKKVPLVQIENKVTNFLNTTKEVRKNIFRDLTKK
jgi:cytoskeletal protein CcmA (bactofilin family)